MRPIVDLIRMEIAAQGRDPRSVKILLMLTTFVGKTESAGAGEASCGTDPRECGGRVDVVRGLDGH